MTLFTLLAIAVSTILLFVLCHGDPKRRRSRGLPGRRQSATVRRLLTMATGLPGVACIALGDAAAFLVWFGGCGAAGWLVALWFSRRNERASRT
jgi:Zn-dependent protease with chaperone function